MEYPAGSQWKFIGEQAQEGRVAPAVWANAQQPLELGSVGTVEAFVPAEVDGAGTHEADCWELSFPSDDVAGQRNISFEAEQLASWFAPVEVA